jgi:glucose-1-phosphate thymidylyltransferase
MLYGYVTTNVPSFVNYARSFGQMTEIPPEIAVETQKRVFQRRRRPHRPCDARLIRDMFELTRAEREVSGKPLTQNSVEL